VEVVAMSAAGIAASSVVWLTYVVESALPFHWTVEFLRKPVPLTVTVSAAPPALALVGEVDERVGAESLLLAAFELLLALPPPPPPQPVTTQIARVISMPRNAGKATVPAFARVRAPVFHPELRINSL